MDSGLKEKLDKLFYWFEEHKFKNEGNYPRNTNLVLEFYDWTEQLTDAQLLDALDIEYTDKNFVKLSNKIRSVVNNGVDAWLGA